MATGIPFPESNLTLTPPTPEDAAAGTVYALHVHRYRDLDGNPNVISKWKFEPEELAGIVANDGEFWFHCWGHTHPPIAILGTSPFVRAGSEQPQAEHPNAADWRNRCERAEALLAERTAERDAEREKVADLVDDLHRDESVIHLARVRMEAFATAGVGIHGGACPKFGEQELRRRLDRLRATIAKHGKAN